MTEENNNKETQNKKKKTNTKSVFKKLNTKNWGIDYMKNEYKEIILSNSNHPEIM